MIDSLPNSDKVKRMLRNSFFLRNILLIKPDLIIHVGADKGQDREEMKEYHKKVIEPSITKFKHKIIYGRP